MGFESDLSKMEASKLLRELADILDSGSSKELTVSGTKISLPNDVDIEVEYESEDGQSELEIEFKWSDSSSAPKGKFTLFAGKNEQWYFNLKASNGQIILASEGYKSKQGAKSGIESVKTNAQAGNFESRVSSGGQPYFVLKAANHEVIGMSQMYKRKVGRDKGIAAVTKYATEAEVVEI